MTDSLLLAVVALVALVAGGLGALLARRAGAARQKIDALTLSRLDALAQRQEALGERVERELRAAIDASATSVRVETGARLAEIQAALDQRLATVAQLQRAELTGFGGQVARVAEGAEAAARANRNEVAAALQRASDGQQTQLADLRAQIGSHLAEVRGTLEHRLAALQQGNEARLEQMRATVEERLQSTLEARLGESFRQVSERLEQVHRGLGEMQGLAQGVGDLKRVLSNVKSRGTFGEVQLGALLEQVLVSEQYEANRVTRPGSAERVEFAVRLPGRDDHGTPVWLPIDAKFPLEDYDRLLAAHEAGDIGAADAAGKAIEARIRGEARRIRDKYVEPPHTTDFAILFLPTEGLFAEVVRRPGLAEALNRELRIVVAGPTTLFAMMNALQMGFRTLALERRSAEVWQVLGAVKTEFGKFGDVLARLRTQLTSASNTIDSAETRTRAMTRALREVEALPAQQAQQLLPPSAAGDDG